MSVEGSPGGGVSRAAPGPARRPSRRAAVIDAAVTVFAERGFADATIPEIAEAADLAPTGVYYHFATKEELFDSVVRQVYSAVDAVAEQARPYAESGDADTLRATISAVWQWAAAHPDHARILYRSPDATPASRVMRREHEQRHVERAYGYLEEDSSRLVRASAAESHAAAALQVRTLIRVQIAVLAAITAGGSLDGRPVEEVRVELHRLSDRLMFGDAATGPTDPLT